MFLSRSVGLMRLKSVVRFWSSSPKVRKTVMTEKITVYGDEISPPVRFVMMTASILEIDVDFQTVDLFKGENKTNEFKKINLLQKVPVMSVNGETICDSHAIALYFCRKDKRHRLYPEDVLLQARIDQMLFFNSSTLFPLDSVIFTEFFAGKWPVDKEKINKWHSALDYLEYRLTKHSWLAGQQMWLCDVCCAATVSSLMLLVPLSERHVLVKQWLEKMENLQFFHLINQHGVNRLQEFVDKMKVHLNV